MTKLFAETLKELRAERGFSQRELARQMYVTQSTIARWENGSRLPDDATISRLAQCLDINANLLLNKVAKNNVAINVLMVEDREIILAGGLAVLEEVMPDAIIAGFEWPSEALEYAEKCLVSLAFVDIELGSESGFDLCRSLLDINPLTNVVYLTAYADYALDAWGTGASGFMLKPITPEGVRTQLADLRHPFPLGGS